MYVTEDPCQSTANISEARLENETVPLVTALHEFLGLAMSGVCPIS